MPKYNAFNSPLGYIEVICGPMFSGKSEELLRKLNRLKYAEVEYLLFKPKIDTRSRQVKSRDGRKQKAIEVKTSKEIYNYIHKQNKKYKVIAIDEAQFFDKNLGDVCDRLADEGIMIYVAGLDQDFRGEPFPAMLRLLSKAEKVTKLTAVCTECGAPATRTQRIIDGIPANHNSPIVKIGNTESYTARCRQHHEIPNKPKI
ncbi:MAG: thymidine kinase [Mycoplasmataceae bacterium]|jgi:thymidine kinase|nr:thymidine kinase [Mycoplasmataceae bacterium]